ncbi:MAG: glycoside hydrolase family 3 protein [Pseudomonadota bacterium]
MTTTSANHTDTRSAGAPSALRAFITGLSGLDLIDAERRFLAEADPWGLIIFARNVETPDRLAGLVADARDATGRHVPVLIDQEGGRVARLRPPHWRDWPSARETVHRLGPEAGATALRLRFTVIAHELQALGIDVDCMPLLDVPQTDVHPIIGERALGEDLASVVSMGQAVIDGLMTGGVLPVIKHIPGHGRGSVDSHLSLPRVAASRVELEAVDFAAFKPFADVHLGMTAHVLFDAIDPDTCATNSPDCIKVIREEIGFGGLLMTDDLSMKALEGSVGDRASRALEAGCDIALHCNGEMSEMEEVAAAVPPLSGTPLARARAAEEARPAPSSFDLDAVLAEYHALTGEMA